MENDPEKDGFLKDWDSMVRMAVFQTITGRVPAVSRETYINEWREFQFWRAALNLPFKGKTNSDEVRGYLAQRWTQQRWTQSATMWSKLSILRTMTEIVDGATIKNDKTNRETQASLKALGKTQTTKQTPTFSRDDVKYYLTVTALDPMSLPIRLILLIGCNIGVRCETLYNLEFQHVQEVADEDLHVTVDFSQKQDQAGRGKAV